MKRTCKSGGLKPPLLRTDHSVRTFLEPNVKFKEVSIDDIIKLSQSFSLRFIYDFSLFSLITAACVCTELQ